MRTLSYSQMNTYLRCPKLWWLKYVQKNWPPVKPQPLCFGIAFHAGAEMMINTWDGGEAALEDGLSRFEFEYALGKDKGPDLETWVPVGTTLLTNLYQFLHSIEFEPIAAEVPCRQKGFRGLIDCHAYVDGKKFLIDWKTASRPWPRSRVEEDDQLTAYGWMVPGEWEGLAYCVVNKNSGEVYWYPTKRSQERIDQFVERMNRIRELMGGQKHEGKYTKKACMAYNHKCDMWEMGLCRGLDDF